MDQSCCVSANRVVAAEFNRIGLRYLEITSRSIGSRASGNPILNVYYLAKVHPVQGDIVVIDMWGCILSSHLQTQVAAVCNIPCDIRLLASGSSQLYTNATVCNKT
jgi:hypothetical protein